MLGHELRNPLSPILTALQLMKLQGAAGCGTRARVIERQVKHLIRLVDDLLDVSRIARGKIELKHEPSSWPRSSPGRSRSPSPLLEQRAHTPDGRGAATRPGRRGDSARLAQVVANLLTNAAKYTPPGGRIAVEPRGDGGEVVLRVRDNGIGIAAELLPRIFDCSCRSAQAHRPLARAAWASAWRSCATWSSCTAARSRRAATAPGRGSEFVVRLPRAAHDACAQPAAASSRYRGVGQTRRAARPGGRRQRGRRAMLAPSCCGCRATTCASRTTDRARSRWPRVPPRRRAARHRAAGDGRLRARAPAARHARAAPDAPGRGDRLRPGARPRDARATPASIDHLVKPVAVDELEGAMRP